MSTFTSVIVYDLRRSNVGFGKHFVSMSSSIIFDVDTYDSVIVPFRCGTYDMVFNVNVFRSC